MNGVGSPEWLAERRTGLGGTDVARILGLSRFGGAMDVFLEKRALSAPLIETEAMRWGKLLEDPVAQEYAVKTGRKIRRAAGFLRHPYYSQFYANIDRWSLAKGTPKRVLEVKTTSIFTADDFGEEGTDQVPGDYLVQVMHYMLVTGTETADLAVLIGGNKHRVYTIERDEILVDDMIERSLAFWRDTQAGIPPAVDGSEASDAYLRATYRDKGTEAPMTSDLAALATMYKGVSAEIAEGEDRKKLLRNEIADAMGDHRWAEGEGVKVTYAERAGASRTNWGELAKAKGITDPDIAEFTTKAEPIRSINVTVKSA